MTVEIDSGSGFCGGVIRAIGRAEEFLSGGGRLYSLGEMVHNEAELARLGSLGMVPVSISDLDRLGPSDTVLIRAHGEPPETYAKAEERGVRLIDCTCPVVLRIQQSIREAHSRLDGKGTIVIFGKIGHAEVLGLVGQTGGDAVVVESPGQLADAISEGRISGPVEVFSQTTKSPVEYGQICNVLSAMFEEVAVHDTICRQVASRHGRLSEFARSHDAVVFVSGRQSSNGHVLFELCRSANPRSFHISDVSGLQAGWFRPQDSVGVCGATSTPRWQLENVAEAIKKLQ